MQEKPPSGYALVLPSSRGPVEKDDPRVLSASQLNVWGECQRRWAWKYIAKIQPPPAKSAQLGVKVHAQLERYLKTGEMPDFVEDAEVGNIASSGLHHLPAPGTPGLEVEKYFKFTSPQTGISYRGFIDACVPGPKPLILDHKTIGDIRYMKTPADLLVDTQAILYAKNAFVRWPQAQEVDLLWVYYQTRKAKKSLPVLQTVTRAHVDHTFPLIEVGSEQILTTLEAKPDPLSLPPNTEACRAYGGCPYQDRCNLSPKEVIHSMMSADVKTQSLIERLQAQAAAPAAGGPIADTDVPAPANIPSVFLGPPTDQPVNPPEAQVPQAAAPVVEAPKAKRGRPRKEKDTIPAPPPEVEVAPAPVIDAVPEGFTLYVDCFPVGRAATVLEKLVARAQAENTANTGKADYRMLDYGQGPGVLSCLVTKYIDEGTYGDIVLDSRTPEGSACKAALVAKASFVVMGLGR